LRDTPGSGHFLLAPLILTVLGKKCAEMALVSVPVQLDNVRFKQQFHQQFHH
jgi:hypothetical protein